MFNRYEKINLPEQSLRALKKLLDDHAIDYSGWGNGSTKTLGHLYKEIESGETILEEDLEGKLVRKLVVGAVRILYYSPDGHVYELREEKQVFQDGRERSRNMPKSLSEKMKCDENPDEAMIRGIQEELQISGDIFLSKDNSSIKQEESPSYPGLVSEYTEHHYTFVMNDEQFRPEGYQELQDDKITYFSWKLLS
jgi:hypothetical protein